MKTRSNLKTLWICLALASSAALVFSPARAHAAEFDAWPLAEFSDDRTVVLYPFYVHEGNFMMAFPLYYRTNQGRDHHVVWPIAKFSGGRLKRFAPFWFSSDQDNFALLPLIYQNPDYTIWTIPPIYTRHDGKFTGVYPFFAKSPDMLFIAPYYQKTTPVETVRNLWPLYFHNSNAASRSDLLLPFYYHSGDAKTDSTWLLPYYSSRSGDSFDWTIFPLMFGSASPAKSSFHMPLIVEYNRETNHGKTAVNVMSLPYQYKHDGDNIEWSLIPLMMREKSPQKSGFTILPIYSYDEDFTADGKSNLSVYAFPYYQSRTGDESQHDLFPLYFHSASPGRSSTTIPPFFYYATAGNGSTLWVLPFWKSVNGNERHGGVPPLWWYSESGPENNRISHVWLFPVDHEHSPDMSSTMVLPLYMNFWAKNPDGDTNELWLLPWVQGSDPKGSYSGFLPLYYASSEKIEGDRTHETFNLLWPVYHRDRVQQAGKDVSYNRRFLIFSDVLKEDGRRGFHLFGLPVYEWFKGN